MTEPSTVLCYGDSNTYGADPETGTRLPKRIRWPRVMAASLGPRFDVIEEGLGGRTTIWDDPLEPGRNGAAYLDPCLASHAPLDVVILMLGTNDLKAHLRLGAEEIARGVQLLGGTVRRSGSGRAGGAPSLLIVAPVPVGEATTKSELWGFGDAREKSLLLAARYELVASILGCEFFDAGAVAAASAVDGVHLDKAAHEAIGLALAAEVRQMVGDSDQG